MTAETAAPDPAGEQPRIGPLLRDLPARLALWWLGWIAIGLAFAALRRHAATV